MVVVNSTEVAMPSKRITVSIPEELSLDLDQVKDRINVSQVCSEALRKRADEELVLVSGDLRRIAAMRFARQRDEWSTASVKIARLSGYEWVLKEASYEDILDLFARIDWDPEAPVVWEVFREDADYFWEHFSMWKDEDGFDEPGYRPGSIQLKLAYQFYKSLPQSWRRAGREPGSDVARPHLGGESDKERSMRRAFLHGIQEAWEEVRVAMDDVTSDAGEEV
jgi:hypothetical protein